MSQSLRFGETIKVLNFVRSSDQNKNLEMLNNPLKSSSRMLLRVLPLRPEYLAAVMLLSSVHCVEQESSGVALALRT